jgi:hypothetical protein
MRAHEPPISIHDRNGVWIVDGSRVDYPVGPVGRDGARNAVRLGRGTDGQGDRHRRLHETAPGEGDGGRGSSTKRLCNHDGLEGDTR